MQAETTIPFEISTQTQIEALAERLDRFVDDRDYQAELREQAKYQRRRKRKAGFTEAAAA